MDQHLESLYPEDSRLGEIARIISFIKAGNSVQLVSIPGVGRSNLLGMLSYNTKVRLKHLGTDQRNYHFVNLNLSEVKNKPNEVFKFIFLELLDSLKERKIEQEYVSKVLRESILMDDEMVIFQGLKKTIEYLTLEKNLTIVLLFDRFEVFIPLATNEFFSSLRIFRNKAKYKFCCIFSLNKPLEEIFEKETLGDFFEFVIGHIVYLPILDTPGLNFRIKHLEEQTGKKIPEKNLKEILKITGGHGKLTRVCLEYYLNTQSEDFLKDKTVETVLFGIKNSLSPSDLNDLINKRPNAYLTNIGFLENGEIRIPLFEKYIKLEKSNQNIYYSKETNEIKLGEQNLFDNLTFSEFKLLKFLIENPNKIITREEIINSVWSQTKSTQGVTDEALDQLISRLRKKIEIDPNSPIHLITIKGRGFKFEN